MDISKWTKSALSDDNIECCLSDDNFQKNSDRLWNLKFSIFFNFLDFVISLTLLNFFEIKYKFFELLNYGRSKI